jgi:predicted RNase H-like nuclease (RuvC/YqgF family)
MHYLKPTEQDVLSEYLKAVDNLTIDEANRLKTKVEELTTKNESNEYIIKSKLQEKDSEIQDLKRQLTPILKRQKELDVFLKDFEKDPRMAGRHWRRVR